MKKKLLSLVLAGTAAIFFTVMGPGCAKKPKTPEVDETKKTEEKAAPEAKAKAPVTETYEGFKPVKEPSGESLEALLAKTQFEDVYFDFDKYDIQGSQKGILENIAKVLKEHSEFFLTVEGHCDARGTNAYNRALGERRAHAVQEFLYALGITKNRVTTVSYGEEKPVCAENKEDCWRKNRRAHFLVTLGGK